MRAITASAELGRSEAFCRRSLTVVWTLSVDEAVNIHPLRAAALPHNTSSPREPIRPQPERNMTTDPTTVAVLSEVHNRFYQKLHPSPSSRHPTHSSRSSSRRCSANHGDKDLLTPDKAVTKPVFCPQQFRGIRNDQTWGRRRQTSALSHSAFLSNPTN